MADIATIGFRAETGELADAKAKLEALTPAAARAQKASDQVSRAMDNTGAAAQRAAAGMQRETTTANTAAGAMSKKASAVNTAASADTRSAVASGAAAAAMTKQANAADHAAAAMGKQGAAAAVAAGQVQRLAVASNDNMNVMKGNTANIAAQFQDIGVTAAMGMNPLMIALQQGTQLAAVFAMSSESAGKTIAAAFGSIISPVSLLVIGLVALVAAGLQFIDWAGVAAGLMTGLASIMEMAAPYILGVGAALALLYAPAIVMGIMSTIALMGRLAVSAAIAAAAMAMANPALALVAGIAIAIAAANIFRDEIKQIFGVDIVGAVADGVNAIIGGFIKGYTAILAVWKMLPAALGDFVYSTANAVIGGVESMVNAVAGKIDEFIGRINSALAKIPDWALPGGSKISIGTIGKFEFGRVDNPNAGAMGEAIATARAAAAGVGNDDYVGMTMEAISTGASKAAGKVRELAKEVIALGAGDADGKKKKAGGGGKTEGEKFEDIVNGAERTIATLQAERDAVGMSAEATARLKHETDLLNQAKQKNIDLSPAQSATLKALAGDMARLETETKRAKDTLEFAKSATKGFIQDFISGIKNGEGVWESFGKAAMNVLDKIGTKLVDMAIDNLFTGGGGSGGGGWMNTIVKGISWLFGGKSALGNVFDASGIQSYAKGGAFTNSVVSRPTLFSYAKGGAFGEMGEAGPEAIMPLERGPDGSLGVQMYGGHAPTSGPVNNNVEIKNEYRIEGAISEEKIVAQIKATAERTEETVKKKLVGWLDQYGNDGAFA